jgi:hypothetical protein
MCETILPEKEIYNKYLIKHDKNNKVLTDLLESHCQNLKKISHQCCVTSLKNGFIF